MSMIETTDLTKRYGDLTAIEDVAFSVEEGSIHGFVGPNGAGKTTTMQILVGLISPSEGEATVAGEPAGSLAAKQSIGYSPQEPTFYESMTGVDYLRYMGRVAGVEDAAGRADELLDWLDLADDKHEAIGGYSGGMKRRLSLAQAMVHEPDLLILDEPTAALDPSGRVAIIDSLRDLTDEGMTVFVSSHVLTELEKFVDTVTILHDGHVIRTDPIGVIQDAYGSESFEVDSNDNERLRTLLADQPAVSQVQTADGGGLLVLTDEPEAFKMQLDEVVANNDVRLEGLDEAGGLEDAFMDIVAEDAEPGTDPDTATGTDPDAGAGSDGAADDEGGA